MSLRRRTFLYLAVVLFLQLVVLVCVAAILQGSGFDKLERVQFRQDSLRVREVVRADLHRIRNVARDYMEWTDTCEFVKGQSSHRSFAEDNFSLDSMENIRIDVCLLFDGNGNLVMERNISPDADQFEAMPPSVLDLAKARLPKDLSAADQPNVVDVARLPEGILLYDFRPVYVSSGEVPACGMGLMGTWLDADVLKDYGRITGITLRLDTTPDLSGVAGSHEAFCSREHDIPDPCVLVPRKDGTTDIEMTFLDSDGRGVFRLVGTKNRLIHQYGARNTLILIVVVMLLGLGISAFSLRLINRDILCRIFALSEAVRRITNKRDAGSRVPVDGCDELGVLAGDINSLLADLGRSEAVLREKEQQFRMLLDKSPLAISITDTSGRLVFVNECFRELTGRDIGDHPTLERMIEVAIPDPIYRQLKLKEMAESLREARETGRLASPVEYHATMRSGRELDIEVYVAEVGGQMFRIVSDVTEKKRMLRDLRDALKARELFMANVSHEIRTPLNGIVGMVQILREMPTTSEQRECLDTIGESCDLLVAIISDILDISRIEAGTLRLFPEPVRLQEFISGLVGLVSHGMTLKGLDFLCEVPDDLPGDLVFDTVRLRQVLLNLLSNAVKFTERGSVTLRATFESAGEGKGSLSLAVVDTGSGISLADRARLFRPFEQVDSSHSRRHGGTGLGLAISDRLVKLMGGQFQLESTPGLGSTFSFSIPVLVAPRGSAAQPQSAAEALHPLAEARCSLRILVAEDNLVNQKVIGMMLRRMGAAPDFAVNGTEAVKMALASNYDTILMDVQMPGMDGLEATREILRRLPENARPEIVALTAHARAEDVQACMEAGMVAHLSKPLKAQDLFRVLLDICKKRHPETT